MEEVSEPEELYLEWPMMGSPGECLHFETEPPVISRNCILIKNTIKNKRKFITQKMMKDPNTNIHLLNENIRNLEHLMMAWESIHYNPRVKWNKLFFMRIFKRNSCVTYWRNSDYNLKSTEDFPPLDPASELIADYESFPFIANDTEEFCFKATFRSKFVYVERVQFPLKQQLNLNKHYTIRKITWITTKSKMETSTSRNYDYEDSDKCSSKDDNGICQTKGETNNKDTNESSNNSLKDESETAEETAETAEEINDHLKTDTCFLNEGATTSTDNSLPVLESTADCQVTEKESIQEEIEDISSKTEILDFNEGENNENTDQATLNKMSLSEDIQVDKTEAEIAI